MHHTKLENPWVMSSLVIDRARFVYGPAEMCKPIYPHFFEEGHYYLSNRNLYKINIIYVPSTSKIILRPKYLKFDTFFHWFFKPFHKLFTLDKSVQTFFSGCGQVWQKFTCLDHTVIKWSHFYVAITWLERNIHFIMIG